MPELRPFSVRPRPTRFRVYAQESRAMSSNEFTRQHFSVDTPTQIPESIRLPTVDCLSSVLCPALSKRKLIKRFINFYIMSTHIIRHNVHWLLLASALQLLGLLLLLLPFDLRSLHLCVLSSHFVSLASCCLLFGAHTHTYKSTCRPLSILSRCR